MILTIDAILAMHGIGGSIGNAGVGDVRTGKTFSTVSGLHTGTLADNGNGPTITPSASAQTLASGIYDTTITINPRPFANGTVTPGAATNISVYSEQVVQTVSVYPYTISGLAFTPSVLVLINVGGKGDMTVVNGIANDSGGYNTMSGNASWTGYGPQSLWATHTTLGTTINGYAADANVMNWYAWL